MDGPVQIPPSPLGEMPELLMKQLESLQRQHAKNPDFYYSARSEYNYGNTISCPFLFVPDGISANDIED